MYLGIRCVIAKSFARIHAANLINSGILPLTFADAGDYDHLVQGHMLRLCDLKNGMKDGHVMVEDISTGKRIRTVCDLTARQQRILLAGGLLNYTREAGE
jgi:aconitate hydratase